jgi:hypothetical protein
MAALEREKEKDIGERQEKEISPSPPPSLISYPLSQLYSAPGVALRMSESPGSVIASTHTRWSFPQAVPSSTLSVGRWWWWREGKKEEVAVSKRRRKKASLFLFPLPKTQPKQNRIRLLTAAVVVHARLREHGVVLDLGLAHGRAVVRDDHELALAAAEALERGLEAQGVLAGLDDERQPGVDVLLGLFLW